MKNIHILPTDKPSKLVLDTVNKNLFLTTTKDFGTKIMQFQNIYITNSEEIKESQVLNKTDYYYVKNHYNEWYVGKFNGVSFDFINDNGNFHSNLFVCKKIILTTDVDLIKDGVQLISDEFLEWFVKNPSCEFVEIFNQNVYSMGKWDTRYSIIIPKEEPKQENCCTPIGQIKRYVDCKGCDRKPKQETIEEVKDLTYYKANAEEDYLAVPISVLRYISQLEQELEKMYSEEEVKQIIDTTLIEYSDFVLADIPHWFEQFKKK